MPRKNNSDSCNDDAGNVRSYNETGELEALHLVLVPFVLWSLLRLHLIFEIL